MAALNGGLGSGGLSNGTGSTMEALTQAYSGIQQYAAAALPTLYNQSLLTQQSISAAGSQKEGRWEAVAECFGLKIAVLSPIHGAINGAFSNRILQLPSIIEAMDRNSIKNE